MEEETISSSMAEATSSDVSVSSATKPLAKETSSLMVALIAGVGVLLVLAMLYLKYRRKMIKVEDKKEAKKTDVPVAAAAPIPESPQLMHKLCPHNNVVQSFEVEQKDSLDEHLDVLTRKLAEKEGRLRLSKTKIRQTQNEIENFHAIDIDVRHQYRDIMESLRSDLLNNENECKKLQEQIEWVSRKRAELKDEVRRGQRLYGEAAAELAANLVELQRGRDQTPKISEAKSHREEEIAKATEKNFLRHRKEPILPNADPAACLVIKSTPPASPHQVTSRIVRPQTRH